MCQFTSLLTEHFDLSACSRFLPCLEVTNISDITQFIILIEYCLVKVSTDERVELIEM